MLSSQQIDTVSGIVSNYPQYVVYYAGDYKEYTVGEERDYEILLYCGDGITFDNGTFTFPETVECYRITYNKYIDSVTVETSLSVPASEIVYTNVLSNYPQLCTVETKLNNTDFVGIISVLALSAVAVSVVLRLLFGGK